MVLVVVERLLCCGDCGSVIIGGCDDLDGCGVVFIGTVELDSVPTLVNLISSLAAILFLRLLKPYVEGCLRGSPSRLSSLTTMALFLKALYGTVEPVLAHAWPNRDNYQRDKIPTPSL